MRYQTVEQVNAALMALKSGDLVKWTRRNGGYSFSTEWGTVERITDKRSLVVKDSEGKAVTFRASKYGKLWDVSIPTAHEIAERQWWMQRPRTRHVRSGPSVWRSDSMEIQVDAETSSTTTVAFASDLRAKAQELLTLAAWWDERPKAPAPEPGDIDEEDEG